MSENARVPRPLFFLPFVLALAACSTAPNRASAGGDGAIPAVHEAFVTPTRPAEELDSLATWTSPDGHDHWVIATGKSTHRLSVYDADTGALLRTVGERGSGPGQFDRPNGIAVSGTVLFAVERDNHRVQALSLPDFKPLGMFGGDVLRSPYGVWIDEVAPGEREIYITDSFMQGAHYDIVPPFAQLNRRVHRFRVWFGDEDGSLQARDDGSFGDTDPDTALRIVESIAGDAEHRRLMIADEDARHLTTLREYTFDGAPTGRRVPDGSYATQAEGVALLRCGGGGYWLGVDQRAPYTLFRLFDRDTLALRATFRGATTALTDGIALDTHGSARFPGGALYAVDRDRSLAAFDLRDIVRTLALPASCVH